MNHHVIPRSRAKLSLLLALFFVLALGVNNVMAATECDLTTSGSSCTIGGVVFQQGALPGSSGSGVLDSFVRIGANTDVIQGYNTDYRPVQFDEDTTATFNFALPMQDIPTVIVGGVAYREFVLDNNQNGCNPNALTDCLISLDMFSLFASTTATLHDYNTGTGNFDASGGGPADLLYDLGDNYIKIDWELVGGGSGSSDISVLVPESEFAAYPDCYFGSTTCNQYVYLYSKFGVNFVNNDGGEEWATAGANRDRGTITIIKDADPADGTDFDFSLSEAGGDPAINFTLDDADPNDNDGINDTASFAVPEGSYTIQETVTSGWQLDSINCTGDITPQYNVAQGEVTFDIEGEESAVCTFTNSEIPPAPGTIVIVKDDTTDSNTEFDFTENINEQGFTLKDTDDNTKTFNDIAPNTYEVTELVPNGWMLDSIVCVEDGTANSSDIGNNTAEIVLEEGETVTCTFTNSPIPPEPGALEVTKVVVWGNTTPDDTQTFEICIQGPSYPIGNESGACQVADFDGETLSWTQLQPGDYTVTETDPGSSWTVDISGSPATVESGQTAQATVTNTYVPPPPDPGTIIIVKEAIPDDNTDFDFDETITNGSFMLQDGDSETFDEVDAGQYTVTEASEQGWKLSQIVCDDNNSTVNTGQRTATINLEEGETVTCTFYNFQPLNLTSLCSPSEDVRLWRVTNPNPFDVDYQVQLKTTTDATPNRTATPGQTTFTTVAVPNDANTTKIVYTDPFGNEQQVTKASNNQICPPPEPGKLIVLKYHDLNQDGQRQNNDEPGLQGWEFKLYGEQQQLIDSKTTGPNGYVTFDDLEPDTDYLLCEVLQPGWINSQAGALTPGSSPGPGGTNEVCAETQTLDSGETGRPAFGNYQEPTGGFCPDDPNVGFELTDVLGSGMGGTNVRARRSVRLNIPNYGDVAELYGQLAAVDVGQMRFARFRYPDRTFITIKDPTSPAHTTFAVNWWGSDLDPSPWIKGQFRWRASASRSPRAFILWPTYNTEMQYANVFEVFDDSSKNHVYWNENGTYTWFPEQTQKLTLPATAAPGADILVKVALVDNNDDNRPVILTVSANGVVVQSVMFGPNAKDTLNLEEFLLENVPAGTDEVVLHLLSPDPGGQYPDGGDSVAMIGAAASYACVDDIDETADAAPATFYYGRGR